MKKALHQSWPVRITLAVLAGVLTTIALGFGTGYLRSFIVVSGSMRPTIQPGDFVFVDAGGQPAKRGLIVAVRNPLNPDEELCKRLMALPGDDVEFRLGRLYVNDQRVSDNVYTCGPANSEACFGGKTLESDEYLVLGDNYRDSYDSRAFGPIHDSELIGLVRCIYWPPSRMRGLANAPLPD